VAVTKTTTPAAIREALEAGVIHFGENRVQDAQRKLAELPSIKSRSTWHMVGHIQTNKVKTVLALFDIIQSVDSLRVAEAISKQSQGRVPVLLEVNVAVEATKFGFSPEELPDAVARIRDLPNVEVRGLMTVAPLVEQQEQVRPVFRRLRELGDRLGLSELSMGMTNDFEVAIEEGATIVRIGRAIFGEQAA
jgi:pyridoxal phosphate enzyme (YggS family)